MQIIDNNQATKMSSFSQYLLLPLGLCHSPVWTAIQQFCFTGLVIFYYIFR